VNLGYIASSGLLGLHSKALSQKKASKQKYYTYQERKQNLFLLVDGKAPLYNIQKSQ
jgi:hypothetical protein